MEHVVFYPSADGVPSFERVSSLDAAVEYAEQLRNVENITEFSVHALTAVPLALRAYYHVEVPAGEESSTDEPVEPVVDAGDEPAVEASAEVATDAAAVDEPAVEASAEAPVDVPVVDEVDVPVADEVDVAVAAEVDVPVADDELIEVPAEPVAESESVAGEITMAPVEADDDRSAEWVAEASVLEPPVAAELPPVPEVAPAVPVAEPVPLVPPLQLTPFADAPPVSAPVSAPVSVPVAEPVAEADADAPVVDVVPIPSGRRSMGFFAR
jgi:hypothetical protein